MGDYRGDYTDMAREYYCGAYEEEIPTEAQLVRDAMGGDWPALALQALIAKNWIDAEEADAAYRKVYGFGVELGAANDLADKREYEARQHPMREVLKWVAR